MNNTVSPKQVQNVIDALQEVTVDTIDNVVSNCNTFFAMMRDNWADEIAVDTAASLGEKMDKVIKELGRSCNLLSDGLVDIANRYAKVAGKAPMNAPHRNFNGSVDYKVVSNKFNDTDEYGFKGNTSNAVGLVADSLKNFTGYLEFLSQKVGDRIKSINAFGNPDIKLKLLQTSSNISSNLFEAGKTIQHLAEDKILEAAKNYDIGDVSQYFSTMNSASFKEIINVNGYKTQVSIPNSVVNARVATMHQNSGTAGTYNPSNFKGDNLG